MTVIVSVFYCTASCFCFHYVLHFNLCVLKVKVSVRATRFGMGAISKVSKKEEKVITSGLKILKGAMSVTDFARKYDIK